MDQSRWEDLMSDCLVNILGRVGMESLVLDVPFVCKSWHTASLNPLCFQTLIIPDPEAHNHVTNIREWDSFSKRFIHQYQIKETCFSIPAFINFVAKRSGRLHATSLLLTPSASFEEVLRYIVQVFPDLKALSLPNPMSYLFWYMLESNMCRISELLGELKHLESLSLSFRCKPVDMNEFLSLISNQCNNLVRLEVSFADMGTAMVMAIVNLLPNIKYLILKSPIDVKDLVLLIEGCKKLEVLEVGECFGSIDGGDGSIIYGRDKEKLSKLASHISNFSSGNFDCCCYYGQYSYPNNYDLDDEYWHSD